MVGHPMQAVHRECIGCIQFSVAVLNRCDFVLTAQLEFTDGIVGIGMPKINFVSNEISKYYDSKGQSGYNYAYLNPGMNKVMQALGRVIRSETDRGAVLLIDERYLTNEYRDLFKAEWREYEVALSPEEVSDILQQFFIK